MVGLWPCLAFAFRGPAGLAVRSPLPVVLLPAKRSVWGRCVVVVLANSRGSVVSGLVRGRDGVGDAVVRMGDGGRDGLPALGLRASLCCQSCGRGGRCGGWPCGRPCSVMVGESPRQGTLWYLAL